MGPNRFRKRAVAGLAVLALGGGLAVAVAVPAQAAATPSTLTLAPANAAVQPGVAQTYTGVVRDSSGNPVAGTTLTIQASQSISTWFASNPLAIAGTGVSSQNKNSLVFGGTFTDQVTLATGSDGGYSFTVASADEGSVTVAVTDGSASGNATLTVSAGGQGDANVKTVAVTPASSTQFTGAAGPTYTVTATDASGKAVNAAEIDYTVTGPDATVNGSHVIAGQTNSAGQVSISIPNTGGAGTDTITFYVAAGSTPSAKATAVFAPVPATTAIGVSTPSDGNPTASRDQLPAGRLTFVPFTATLRNGSAPVANALVVFTVSGVAAGTVTATTDADGTATTTAQVSAAAATAGTTLSVTASVGNPGGPNYRVSAAKTVTFSTPAPYLWFSPATAVQAAVGGTVSITANVTDQFGTAGSYTGDVLNYTVTGRNATSGSVKIGADGTALIAYTDKGTSGSTDTVSVTDTTTSAVNSNPNSTPTATVTFLSSTTPAGVTVPSGGPTTPVTVSSTQNQPVTATVVNGAGDALSYQPVTVTVSSGFVGGPSVTAANGKTSYQTTSDGSGAVTFSVGSTKAGVQKITISAGKASASVPSITYQPASAYAIAISPTKAALVPTSKQTFTATVRDEYGNPVGAGTAVTVDGSGVGTVTSGTAPYQTGTSATGTVPITVTVPGSVTTGSGTVTATLSQTPAQAGDTTTAPKPAASATYTVAPLTSKTGTVGTITISAGVGVAGRSQTITALVKNTAGSRLVEHAVVFSVSGRNTVKPTTVKTNSSGVATLRYVPARPGTEKVTVTSSPVTATATVSVAVQPRLTARSTAKHQVTLTIRTVPKIKHRNVFGYRVDPGGARVPIGLATTNAKGVATLLVVGLKSGKRYTFTVWLAYTSVPELYAKTVTVKVR